MNIKHCFEVIDEFLGQIYWCELDDNSSELDEEKGFEELSSDEEYCECNLCYMVREIMLFINPKMINHKFD